MSKKLVYKNDDIGGVMTVDIPVGCITPFVSVGDLPSGFLVCDGSAVSREMYADLFNLIGTNYGEGDGSTTFNLPTVTGSGIRYIIKTFDSQTRDSALIDVTQYAQDLANKIPYTFTRRARQPFTLANLELAVATGDYAKYNINPGDYYEGASGYTYIVAGDNPMKGTYTGYPITENHAGLIVDTHTTSVWNSTNTTTGGYVSSVLHSYLVNTVLPKVKTDLGTAHLISHRKLYSTAIGASLYNRFGSASGASNSWAWSENQFISALSEVQVYGSIVWSSSGYDTGEADQQLRVFKYFKHTDIFNNQHVWLRDVVSSSYAATAHGIGNARGSGASNALGAVGFICYH